VDLYRVSGVEEAFALGMDEFLGDAHAICIIEWAERAQPLIPPEHLWIRLGFPDYADQTRRALRFTAQGERHAALLREFRQTAFGA
jgi:tRNA threonylcarbamoyladenosine biosynthesis protein TsaE